MEKPSILTKICSHCGQQKPLSAFPKLSGVMGTVYGNICATCRKATTQKNGKNKEKEDTTTSITGFKIDSKSKIHEDLGKQEQFKQTEELYHEDREKEAKIELNKEQKIETKAKEEKNHRKRYLAFLNNPKKPAESNQSIASGLERIAKENEIDLTAPMLDTQQSKEKFKSSVFKQLQTLLGNAPISRFLEQSLKQKDTSTKESKTLTEEAEKSFRPKKGP